MYVFGIDVPFIEVITFVMTALLIIVLAIVYHLVYINKKEYEIIRAAEDIIETEHHAHHKIKKMPEPEKAKVFLGGIFKASKPVVPVVKSAKPEPVKPKESWWEKYQKEHPKTKKEPEKPIIPVIKLAKPKPVEPKETWLEQYQKRQAKLKAENERNRLAEEQRRKREIEKKQVLEIKPKKLIIPKIKLPKPEPVKPTETWWARYKKEHPQIKKESPIPKKLFLAKPHKEPVKVVKQEQIKEKRIKPLIFLGKQNKEDRKAYLDRLKKEYGELKKELR